MIIRLKKDEKQKYVILFAIFIILMENIFYLLDVTSINVSGSINYDDYWLVFYIAVMILICIKYKNCLLKSISRFDVAIFLLIMMVFISMVTSTVFLNESLITGIRSQRWFLSIMLSYYPIKVLVEKKLIDAESFISMIIFLGVLEAVIYLTQYIFADNTIFLYVKYNYDYGDIRLYVDSCVIVIMTIFSMSKLMQHFSLKYLIFIILGLSYEFFVSKGRLENIALLIALLTCFLIFNKKFIKKIPAVFIGTIALLFLLSRNLFVSKLFNTVRSLITGDTISSMMVRTRAHVLFAERMLAKPLSLIFGYGYPNVNDSYAQSIINGYLIEDNGMFAFFFVYGIIGCIIILWIAVHLIKNSIYLANKSREPGYLSLGVFSILISYNIIFWWWKADWSFIYIVLICLIETKTKELRYEYREKGIQKFNKK